MFHLNQAFHENDWTGSKYPLQTTTDSLIYNWFVPNLPHAVPSLIIWQKVGVHFPRHKLYNSKIPEEKVACTPNLYYNINFALPHICMLLYKYSRIFSGLMLILNLYLDYIWENTEHSVFYKPQRFNSVNFCDYFYLSNCVFVSKYYLLLYLTIMYL